MLAKPNIRLTKQRLFVIVFIVFLVATNFAIGDHVRDTLQYGQWRSDDLNHISAAQSFREGKDFELNFALQNTPTTLEEALSLYEEDFTLPYGRGPVYYIILGSFYTILDTKPPEFLFHATILSNILASLFLILYFFLVKKYFDLKIAIFSSLIVFLNPQFLAESIRAMLFFPSLFLAVGALFFLKKTTSHYFIFGVLIGLAHLVHQSSILLGIGYCLFLLIKREFKGALITFASWIAVLIPVFVRNYYDFKDIGAGLYLPLSDRISSMLWFLPTKVDAPISNALFPTSIDWEPIQNWIDPFLIFENAIKARGLDHIDYLFLFSFFGFFAFIYLKKLSSMPVIEDTISRARSLVLFYIPKNIPRFYLLVFLLIPINILALYYLSVISNTAFFPIRNFYLLSFLFIPLAFISFRKIIRTFTPKRRILSKVIEYGLISFVILIVTLQSIQGMEKVISVPPDAIPSSDDYVQGFNKMSSWIYSNIPNDSIISAPVPGDIWLFTGVKGVGIPTNLNCENVNQYIDHFNLDYVIWYYHPHNYDIYTKYPNSKYYFQQIYNDIRGNEIPDFVIYKINKLDFDLLKGQINDQVTNKNFVEVGILIENLFSNYASALSGAACRNDVDEFNNLQYRWLNYIDEVTTYTISGYEKSSKYYDLISRMNVENYPETVSNINDELKIISIQEPGGEFLQLYKLLQLILLKEKAYEFEYYDQDYRNTILIFDEMIKLEKYTTDAWKNKIRILAKTGQMEELNETIKNYFSIYDELRNSKPCNPNYVGQCIDVIPHYISELRALAKMYENLDMENTQGQLQIYQRILDLDKFNFNALIFLGQYYEEKTNYSVAIYYYDQALFATNSYELKGEIELKIAELKKFYLLK